jgi:hypothetical protein
MVILNESSEVLAQTSFPEHDHVIEAFASNSADHPFDIRTVPRRPRCGKHLFDAHRLHLSNEVVAEYAIAIAQQIARGTLPRERFAHLLGRPLPRSGVPRRRNARWNRMVGTAKKSTDTMVLM